MGAAGGPNAPKAPGASIMGPTVGEGANQKTVLDTSDFDAEDGDAHQASTGPGTKSGTSAQSKELQPDAKTESAPTKPKGDTETKAAPAKSEGEVKATPAVVSTEVVHQDTTVGDEAPAAKRSKVEQPTPQL